MTVDTAWAAAIILSPLATITAFWAAARQPSGSELERARRRREKTNHRLRRRARWLAWWAFRLQRVTPNLAGWLAHESMLDRRQVAYNDSLDITDWI